MTRPALIIDIETVGRTIPGRLIKAKRDELALEYKKEETIDSHLTKYVDRCKFLPGLADIICVGIVDSRDGVFKTFYIKEKEEREKALVEVAEILDSRTTEYVVSGFNIRSFDLAHLLEHFAACEIALSNPLSRFDVVDLYEWAKFNGLQGSLNEISINLGLPEKCGSGADVEALYRQDLKDGGSRVADYNKQDLVVELALYRYVSRVWRF